MIFANAPGKRETNDPITDFLQTVSDVVFADPFQKEEIEIRKRIQETNQAEIRNVRIHLKNLLRERSLHKETIFKDPQSRLVLEQDLEHLKNLGGFLWKGERDTLFQWGDWSDYYEDGFSKNKIRLEGQIPSFVYEGDTIYFFIRNAPGSFPVPFDFVGWESNFYAFGDEGSLRYTNDFRLDPSERLGDFRKNFDTIRKKIPGSQILQANDLTIFLIPGKPKPIYYVFLFLRFFLVGWTILLLVYIVRMSLSFPKNHLPEDRVPLS